VDAVVVEFVPDVGRGRFHRTWQVTANQPNSN
jgi:hypothetical protein